MYVNGLTPAEKDQVIPPMVVLLGDSSKHVRMYAAGGLGNLGPQSSNAVPALMLNLNDDDSGPTPGSKVYVRAWTITALGKIGAVASPALPALNKLTNDSDSAVRWKAAAAIWRISSNVETTLPVLIQELPAGGEKWNLVDVLGEMGPHAKDAVPALEGELEKLKKDPLPSRTDANAGRHITNALLKIDPDAAARLGIKK